MTLCMRNKAVKRVDEAVSELLCLRVYAAAAGGYISDVCAGV